MRAGQSTRIGDRIRRLSLWSSQPGTRRPRPAQVPPPPSCGELQLREPRAPGPVASQPAPSSGGGTTSSSTLGQQPPRVRAKRHPRPRPGRLWHPVRRHRSSAQDPDLHPPQRHRPGGPVRSARRHVLRSVQPSGRQRWFQAAKNHSITPIKFDAGSIGGFVRYWARVDAAGKVIASRPRAKIVAWYANPTGPYSGGIVRWGKPIGRSCFSLATIESFLRSTTPAP